MWYDIVLGWTIGIAVTSLVIIMLTYVRERHRRRLEKYREHDLNLPTRSYHDALGDPDDN